MIRVILLATCLIVGWAGAGHAQSANCPLPFLFQNGAVADATQVMSNLNTLAVCIGNHVTPLNFGCKGDGVIDDTICLQNAVNTAVSSGVPLYLNDGLNPRKYFISSTISTGGNLSLDGSIGNFGIFGGGPLSGNYTCPTGIIVNSDIVALRLSGPTFNLRNICIQMAATEGTRLAGAGISTGAITGHIQSGAIMDGVMIFFPYEGLLLDSDPTHTLIQQQENTYRNVMIRGPTATGIVVGRDSTADGTSGVVFDNPYVACGGTGTLGNTQIGTLFVDGDMDWKGRNEGNADCFVNFKIATATGTNVGGNFEGVIGDSAGTHATAGTPHELMIQVASGSVAAFLHFGHTWISGGTTPNGDVPIYIANPTGQPTSTCSDIEFIGIRTRTAGTSKMFDYEGGCTNITLEASDLTAWNNGTVTDGIYLHPQNLGTEGNYNIIGNHIGFGDNTGAKVTNGIHIVQNGTVMQATILGNDLRDEVSAGTPIVYTPNGENMIIANNGGVDDQPCTVVSNATITLPNACSDVRITGNTSITNIAGGAWFTRFATLYSAAGVTINNGGSPGICSGSSVTIPANTSKWIRWNNANNCWMTF